MVTYERIIQSIFTSPNILKPEYLENRRPIILGLSDMHLGASRSRYDEFNQFLTGILFDNEFKKDFLTFDYLIILGDLFDLCFSFRDEVIDCFQEIFHNIDLFMNDGIQVIYLLGNHEAAITNERINGEIEDFNSLFYRRKCEFVDLFLQTNRPLPNFLRERNIFQYAILSIVPKKEDNPPFKISTYDDIIEASSKQEKEKFKDYQYNFLLLHGHQLDPPFIRHFCGPMWKRMIESTSRIFKKVIDVLYNGVLKGGYGNALLQEGIDERNLNRINNIMNECEDFERELREEDHKSLESALRKKSMKEVILFFKKRNFPLKKLKLKDLGLRDLSFIDLLISILFFKRLKNIAIALRSVEIHLASPWGKKAREESIKEFLTIHNLDMITHILYGHTHDCGYNTIQVNGNDINTYNDGAWQQNDEIPTTFGVVLLNRQVYLMRNIEFDPCPNL